MHKPPETYIQHIQECVLSIFEYTSKMSEEEFIADRKTQDAVIRNLEVMGEASKKLDSLYKSKFPDIPWSLMAGMRDVLIHDYEGVDVLRVWGTIQKDLPALKSQLEKIIS